MKIKKSELTELVKDEMVRRFRQKAGKKPVRMTESHLRTIINEMLGAPPNDPWHQLDAARESCNRAVQGLQGTLAASQHGVPGNAKQSAARAAVAVQRLLDLVNGIAAG